MVGESSLWQSWHLWREAGEEREGWNEEGGGRREGEREGGGRVGGMKWHNYNFLAGVEQHCPCSALKLGCELCLIIV